MMKRNLIKKILREETEYEIDVNLSPYTETKTKTSTDISVGLMHKAMNHLASAVRDIESAIQFAEEDELIEGLESIRKSLIHSNEGGVGWEGDYGHDNVINQLNELISDNSENYANFNLNGDHDEKAPTGEFE